MKLPVTAGRPKVDLDNGTYPITIVAIAEGQIENPQYGDGRVVRIDMEFDGMVLPDGDPVILDAIANPKLSPKSKLGGWCKALGFDLEIGQEFDLDELVGAKGLAVIENESKDGQDWPRVVNIVGTVRTNRTTVPPADTSKPDIGAFWEAAYALEKDRPKLGAFIKKLTGNNGVAGMNQETLDALLAEIRKEFGHQCKHGNAAYTEEGEFICRDCGLAGPALEEALKPA